MKPFHSLHNHARICFILLQTPQMSSIIMQKPLIFMIPNRLFLSSILYCNPQYSSIFPLQLAVQFDISCN